MARFYPTGGTGGANVSVVTALAEDVAKGKVIVGPDGKPITGTLELTGTAADSQVLAGQTYYNTDLKTKRTGAMTNRGAWNSSGLAAGAAVTIPAGYHNGGGKVTAKDLASQTSGDATAAQIWTGKKAWVSGRQITGTLATQGGSTTTPGTAAKTVVTPNKIITGSIIVAGDGNLVPGNIKRGVPIFGVTGNWEGYVGGSNDLYYLGANNAGFSKISSSISFESGAIYYNGSGYDQSITSSKSYNLSAWTKLNVQFVMTSSLGNGTLGIALGDNIYNGNPDASIRDSSINSKLNQTITASLDISNVNKTTQIKFFIGPTNLNNNFYGQVKRIWLS